MLILHYEFMRSSDKDKTFHLKPLSLLEKMNTSGTKEREKTSNKLVNDTLTCKRESIQFFAGLLKVLL